jgi:hypothetical protein
MSTTNPVVFCATYPVSCTGPLQVRLPFGLPTFNAPDVSCQSIDRLLDQLNVTLAFFVPIVKTADCLLKLVMLLKAVPKLLGPPPKIKKFIREVSKLAECVDLLTQFSGINYVAYCKTIRDILSVILCALMCLSHLIVIAQQNDDLESTLRLSGNPIDVEQADCLAQHTTQLRLGIQAKFNAIGALMAVINILIETIPGFSSLTGGPIDADNLNASGINDAIVAIQKVIDLLAVCG